MLRECNDFISICHEKLQGLTFLQGQRALLGCYHLTLSYLAGIFEEELLASDMYCSVLPYSGRLLLAICCIYNSLHP